MIYILRHAVSLLSKCRSQVINYQQLHTELSLLSKLDLENLIINVIWSNTLHKQLNTLLANIPKEGPFAGGKSSRHVFPNLSGKLFGDNRMLVEQSLNVQNITTGIMKLFDDVQVSGDADSIQSLPIIMENYIEHLIHKALLFIKQSYTKWGLEMLEKITATCCGVDLKPAPTRVSFPSLLSQHRDKLNVAWIYVVKNMQWEDGV